jgi:plasmid stabilization system protein ParE
MKVQFSQMALSDLYAELAVRAVNDMAAAEHFYGRLQYALHLIGQFPESAQEVAARPGIRRLALWGHPFIVYYKIIGGTAVLLRMLRLGRPRVGIKL